MRRETVAYIVRLLAAVIIISIGIWGLYELNKLSLDAMRRAPPLSPDVFSIWLVYALAFIILAVLILVGLALLIK